MAAMTHTGVSARAMRRDWPAWKESVLDDLRVTIMCCGLARLG